MHELVQQRLADAYDSLRGDRRKKGTLLGNTPFTLTLPKDGELVDLELRATGYEDLPFVIGSLTDDRLALQLTKKRRAATKRSAGEEVGDHENLRTRKGATDKRAPEY